MNDLSFNHLRDEAFVFFSCLVGLAVAWMGIFWMGWRLVNTTAQFQFSLPPLPTHSRGDQNAGRASHQAIATLLSRAAHDHSPATRTERHHWRLIGVFRSERPTHTTALLVDEQGKVNRYAEGAEIAVGVRLNHIASDRVVLTVGKKLETLLLDPMPSEAVI